MALASVVSGEIGNLAGSSVLIAHELHAVYSGAGAAIGTAGVRHIYCLDACGAVAVEERAVIKLDTIVDDT